ncbi:MAG: hypothetical protein KY476_12820 [Planctomycetes bacterium]|nr:hypothetical protein [Planctomycetota bacterium]
MLERVLPRLLLAQPDALPPDPPGRSLAELAVGVVLCLAGLFLLYSGVRSLRRGIRSVPRTITDAEGIEERDEALRSNTSVVAGWTQIGGGVVFLLIALFTLLGG